MRGAIRAAAKDTRCFIPKMWRYNEKVRFYQAIAFYKMAERLAMDNTNKVYPFLVGQKADFMIN